MLSLCITGALAFQGGSIAARAKTARSAIRADEDFAYGLNGVTGPIGPFDPLGFSNVPERLVRYYREVEITHGRVSMLAALGFLVQENYHPFFDIDGPAINQIPQTPEEFWFALVAGIAAAESYRINIAYASPQDAVTFDDPTTPENESSGWDESKSFTLKDDYMPGNLGFDPLGLKPKTQEAFDEMQAKELNNGRLAMIAAAGFLAQEAVSQKQILENLLGN